MIYFYTATLIYKYYIKIKNLHSILKIIILKLFFLMIVNLIVLFIFKKLNLDFKMIFNFFLYKIKKFKIFKYNSFYKINFKKKIIRFTSFF